jgi:serine/threonine protein kinase
MANAVPVPAIGRYRVERVLGSGAQGTVFLAVDPQLDRQVAIKKLHPGNAGAEGKATLIAEARTVSRLSHPNVVTLHDIVVGADEVALVFEYVDGETLDSRIRSAGRLPCGEAVALASGMLDGLGAAHTLGIVHRDIKPANIMIDGSGRARIMDFGIAAAVGSAPQAPSGTPRYMAPEAIANKSTGAAADVFAVGLVLYEMLVGRPAVWGGNVLDVMHRIANVPFEPPSRAVDGVDEALDQIVMRAIDKDASNRFRDAAEMLRVLRAYRRPQAPEAGGSTASGSSTLDFLLMRMRHKSTFPALSQTVSTINRITAGGSQQLQALSEALHKDFALSNRLLRIVNSSSYGQFRGSVTTISRAVMILGFDAVRDIALSLVLFEHLHNRAQAADLQDRVFAALFGGTMTRRIARLAGARDADEGFVCGTFHPLGRLLATFYLYDESVEIERKKQQEELDEATASKAVLGISYEDLGIGIARSWGMPETILAAMAGFDPGGSAGGAGANTLHIAANASSAVARIALEDATETRDARLEDLLVSFGSALGLDRDSLAGCIVEGIGEFVEQAGALANDSGRSRFVQAVRAWRIAPATGAAPCSTAAPANADIDATVEHVASPAGAGDAAGTPAPVESAETLLTAGIQKITTALVSSVDVTTMLRTILETMSRAMGLSRALMFMHDARTGQMIARLGLGAGTERLLGKLAVPRGRTQDVFQAALDGNADLLVADANAPNIADRIPQWYRDSLGAGTFLLLPIGFDKRVIGLLYADRERAGELDLSQGEFNLLKTMRNQALLAIRSRN